ncbi:uncharacterized protein LOC6034508 [Culex quinquefasciatus]|uniref:uncharacterized protein LOC6034508 n=1 Tax=Culex quinquefasciatus TaxID=7176 RepID=UPI0018E309F7|nr:uncharacterized protein LOC6034508 [Culex quinquefasciatus]
MTPRRTKSRSNSAVQRPCSLGSKSKSSAHSSDSTESKFSGPRWPTRVLGSPVRGEPNGGYKKGLRHVVAREFGKHLHRSDCWRRFWGLVPGGRSSSGGHSAQVDSRGKGRRSTSRTSGGTRIRSRDVPARCAMLEISQIDDPSTLHRSQHLYPGGPAADVTEHEKDLYNHYQKHSFRGAGHKYFGK